MSREPTSRKGWLDLLRSHLIENLTLDREDFTLYTFTIAGATRNRANHNFDNRLQSLLNQLNQAITE